MPRPTVRDVAQRAGTSTAVVSYVLNDGPRPVSADTRRRVLDAIADLGYRRDLVARSMRAGRTETVGVVVPDLRKPFFAQLAAAVEAAAAGRHRTVLVGTSQFDQDREVHVIGQLLDSRVDGLVVVASEPGARTVDFLAQSGVAHVLVHTRVAGAPCVTADDHAAGALAFEHLHQHGHRAVACLSGPAAAGSPVSHRTDGFVSAATSRSGHVPDEWVRRCEYGDLHGNAYRATLELLRTFPEITALCATTDEHALGAMRAAAEIGRRVGEDLSLISIDGTEQAKFLTPSLSTVTIPFDGLAGAALQALDGASAGASEPTLPLGVTLEPRQSCGCGSGALRR